MGTKIVMFLAFSLSLVLMGANDFIFFKLFDTDHLLTRAELDELKHSGLNRTADERTRHVIEKNETQLDERTQEYLAWMETRVGHYRNESNEEVGRILSGFGERFEEERSGSRQEFNEQLLRIKKLIGEEKAKLAQQIENLQKQIEQVQEDVDSKNEQLRSLEKSIKEADVNKDEVTFVFEVDNITTFLKDSKSYERRFSEYFQCKGIRWYLDISQSALSNGQKVLSAILHSHNPDEHDWKIEVDFELSVLNQSGKEDSPVLSYLNETFRSRDKNFDDNIGWINVIPIETLEKGGFIKGDTIKVQVKLKANTKLIREARD